MTSIAEICNRALSHIKQTRSSIANLATDQGKVASVLRLHYDSCRRFVLSDHDWNFATQRLALTQISDPPVLYNFRYDYPSDCLRFRKIEGLTRVGQPTPFEVILKSDGSGKSIVTDREQAIGVYTRDIKNVSLFTPSFISAFSWYLASEIAPALSEDSQTQRETLEVYRIYIAAAEHTDSNEAQPDPEPASPWDQARGNQVETIING